MYPSVRVHARNLARLGALAAILSDIRQEHSLKRIWIVLHGYAPAWCLTLTAKTLSEQDWETEGAAAVYGF